MFELKKVIESKLELIEYLIEQMSKNEVIDALEILKREMDELRKLNEIYIKDQDNKQVVKSEQSLHKTRFYLKDGSTYVVTKRPTKNYKYLFDSKTKVITYEFENGQIERTFECGLKEIRTSDGKVFIKTDNSEYEKIN